MKLPHVFRAAAASVALLAAAPALAQDEQDTMTPAEAAAWQAEQASSRLQQGGTGADPVSMARQMARDTRREAEDILTARTLLQKPEQHCPKGNHVVQGNGASIRVGNQVKTSRGCSTLGR